VIASMTAENGMGCISAYPKAINSLDFIEFLQKLRRKHVRRSIALFMDNLAVHKSRDVQPYYESLDITPVYNVGYSPEFNPIEAVFSKVKSIYNTRRLNCLVNKIGFNADNTIRFAFRTVSTDHCAACVRKSRHLLERAC
jgi:transposase